MSEIDGTSGTRHCGGDVAAYALGALEQDELEAFRRHLQTCAVCREELTAFEQVVEALPMSAPQYQAPRSLRRRVLSEIERERVPQRRRPSFPIATGRLVARPALAAGLALAVIALAVLGLLTSTSAGPTTRVYAAQVIGSGSAKLAVTGGHAELIVSQLPPPPAGQIYEVWLGRPGRPPVPTSALFSVTASGQGDVAVPGNLHGVRIVMVTTEPAGGSRVPTHPPVIRAQLS